MSQALPSDCDVVPARWGVRASYYEYDKFYYINVVESSNRSVCIVPTVQYRGRVPPSFKRNLTVISVVIKSNAREVKKCMKVKKVIGTAPSYF